MTTDKPKVVAAITNEVLEKAKKRVEKAGVAWPEDHNSPGHERAKSAREAVLQERQKAKDSSPQR